MFSRRIFLGGSALAALSTACGRAGLPPTPATHPSPRRGTLADAVLDEVVQRALEGARRGGASYADVRIVRRRSENVSTREDHVASVGSSESYGVGVRVIVNGAWGFAATSRVEGPLAEAAAERAVAIAKAARSAQKRPVTLAPAPVVRDRWRTKMEIDPFEVPLADKVALLLELWPLVRDVPNVKFARAGVDVLGEWKLFASSEGSVIEQSVTRVEPSFSVTAVRDGEFESREAEIGPRQAGWEYITRVWPKSTARQIAEEAVEKLKSPRVVPGKRDLILAPSNLWLTIHESVGHPTELDRMVGEEANFAGTSFATIDQIGHLMYASEAVTIVADRTTEGGLASCGYDDDGVATGRWNLIENGRFVGVQTTRDQAGWIGERASRGTSYGEDYKSVAFQRMPNVSLAPGPKPLTLQDLVAATDDGVLITGNGSWSIDHQRYNFQFGGQMFYAVKGGKVAGALRHVAYQSNSLEFWRACDLVGGAGEVELFGSLYDGKGEPPQMNAVSHGCPPARFRGVSILDAKAKA